MLNFLVGEERTIRVHIKSKKKQVIVITDAFYSITDRNGKLISDGALNINGCDMTLLYQPEKSGVFTFEVTYTIPPETLKARCDLNVT